MTGVRIVHVDVITQVWPQMASPSLKPRPKQKSVRPEAPKQSHQPWAISFWSFASSRQGSILPLRKVGQQVRNLHRNAPAKLQFSDFVNLSHGADLPVTMGFSKSGRRSGFSSTDHRTQATHRACFSILYLDVSGVFYVLQGTWICMHFWSVSSDTKCVTLHLCVFRCFQHIMHIVFLYL